jgi:hypothetical protein
MRSAILSLAASVFLVTALSAQQPVLKLTATSVNVTEPGNVVRIDITRWSTNPERDQLLAALTPPAPAPAPLPPTPEVTTPPTEAAAGAARGGRGGGGRGAQGARGGGRGGRGGNAAPALDPIATLTAAISKAPTIGYIWTNEVAGYAIKYAWRAPSADGGERIIVATNRRIGAHALSWNPVGGSTPTAYEFTFVEIRLPLGRPGEAKTSLSTSIAIDNEAKTIALENYATAQPLLARVSHR